MRSVSSPTTSAPKAASESRPHGQRTGVLLVTFGAALAAFVVIVLLGALHDPQKLPLLAFVQDRLGSGGVVLDVVVGGRQVQVRGSQGSAFISGIVVSVLTLGVLGRLAGALLASGARLMRSSSAGA